MKRRGAYESWPAPQLRWWSNGVPVMMSHGALFISCFILPAIDAGLTQSNRANPRPTWSYRQHRSAAQHTQVSYLL
jgi:hypothetical protein